MKPTGLFVALSTVADALEALGVRYYVGGSIASSARGVARASLDVDLVAELRTGVEADLAKRLAASCYVSEGAIRRAIVEGSSFNAIHLETMFKVDVFVAGNRPFDREALSRARLERLDDEEPRRFPIATAEDVILAKLAWFRLGGERSERQWVDVAGVLRASCGDLDGAYLARHAAGIGVGDLLERALREAEPG